MRPATERELAEMLAAASAERTPLEIVGNGSKTSIGRPVQAHARLSTASLKGVTLYEPTELVMSALAGTPLSRIEAELAANGQMLAFEPLELGPLCGGPPGQASIGGVFMSNLSGARRIVSGAARDHLLGVRALGGAGQTIKSGGRVMKNVTGYDLTKLLAGSWGTLAVATELTFKVLPAPEATATLMLLGLSDDLAIEALCHAMGTPYEVTGAAHLQAPVAQRLTTESVRAAGRAATLIRLEGFTKSVAYRGGHIRKELAAFGEVHVLSTDASLELWSELQRLSAVAEQTDPLWRISTSPASGAKVVAAIRQYMDCRVLYDWSGGLIWLEVLATADAGAADIRRVVASHGGHATLVRAAPAVRASVDVFQPMEQGVADLTRGIKSVFDPAQILNPGRMYAGV
ncbi:MAG TPA: FAD-binding protein [Hyphomicrobiaceae bacterium]|nr:FAD-binding protein [Hyphomicrobiaceae bacterium]